MSSLKSSALLPCALALGLLACTTEDPATGPDADVIAEADAAVSTSDAAGSDPDGATALCKRSVGGYVSGSWSSADSPVCVTEDLVVASGESLTIAAGVAIRFEGPHRLLVEEYGRLSAAGTPASPVVFESASEQPYPGDWGPIAIGFDGEATLRWAEVRHGRGLVAYYSSPVVTDSTFADNAAGSQQGVIVVESQGAALGHSGELSPQIERSTFEGNDGNCLALLRSGGTVAHNTFDGCSDAAVLVRSDWSDTAPAIRHNALRDSGDAGIRFSNAGSFSNRLVDVELNVLSGNRYGIYLEKDAEVVATHNDFVDNEDAAIYVTPSAISGSSYARNNWWGTTDASAVTSMISATGNHAVAVDPIESAPIESAGP